MCSAAKDQVTVPPAAMVTQFGEKLFDVVALTDAVAAGLPPATVTETPGLDVTLPELAVTVADPTPMPVAVFEAPLALANDRIGPVEGPQVMVALAIGLFCASLACAVKFTVPHGAIVCGLVGEVITTLAT